MALQTYPVQGDACFTFSEPRRRLFHQAILDLPPDLHKPENAPSPKLALLGDLLPIQLRERLIAFRRYGTEPGAFLIRNLPTGASLPPTPSDGKPCSSKTSRVSEYCLLTMMLQLGEAIGYVNEKDGQLVHDVCPVRDQEQRQENTGSVDFDLHTENAFHDHPPDYVGLICLRADRRGEALTLVGPIRHSVPLLSADQVATLRQATYRVRPPSSFVTTGPAIEQPRLLPIISGPICNPRLRVDFHNMAGSDDNATAAMANLKDVLTSTAVGIALTPGDMLIIDNAAAAHGRTAFRPYYDGHDRWLQRAYAARDLQMSSSSRRPGSHVLTASLGSDNRG